MHVCFFFKFNSSLVLLTLIKQGQSAEVLKLLPGEIQQYPHQGCSLCPCSWAHGSTASTPWHWFGRSATTPQVRGGTLSPTKASTSLAPSTTWTEDNTQRELHQWWKCPEILRSKQWPAIQAGPSPSHLLTKRRMNKLPCSSFPYLCT